MTISRVTPNRAYGLLLAFAMIALLAACGEDKAPPAPSASAPAAHAEPEPAPDDPIEPIPYQQEEVDPVLSPPDSEAGIGVPSLEEAASLEEVSAKDAEEYLKALKKEDAEQMSILMAHAENENLPETMRVIVEGFKLHFDRLDDLKLVFESNQQDDEYYIENYWITGTKDGEARSIPFRVMYYKPDGIEKIRDDARREPLFDSPLLNQYPYMIDDVERYITAIQEEDKESLALHLGLYDETEENASAVDRLLGRYKEELDLGTTNVIPTGYDENEKLFRFELKDGQDRSHRLQVAGATWLIQDDWTKAE